MPMMLLTRLFSLPISLSRHSYAPLLPLLSPYADATLTPVPLR